MLPPQYLSLTAGTVCTGRFLLGWGAASGAVQTTSIGDQNRLKSRKIDQTKVV